MRFPRRAVDGTLMGLLEDAGSNVHRSGVLLRDLLAECPEYGERAEEILACEHEGDRITHDIIHRLNGARSGRAPFTAGDGYLLATALDDIVDHSEQVAAELDLYRVEAPLEQAVELAEVLVAADVEIRAALGCLCQEGDPAPHLIEIHRLENEGDRLQRAGVAALFETGIDPMVVIRWKDIYESLEEAVDACEKVAHIIEGMTLKRSYGRHA